MSSTQAVDMVWLLLIYMEFNFVPNTAGTTNLFSMQIKDLVNPTPIRMDRIQRALFRFVIMNGPLLVANHYLDLEVWAILRVSAHCVYGCMTCGIQYGPAHENLKCYCLFFNIARRDAAMVSWLVNFLALSDNRYTCGGTLEYDTFWSPQVDNKIYHFDCYSKFSTDGHMLDQAMKNKNSLLDVLVQIRMDCKEFFKKDGRYESPEDMREAAKNCLHSWKGGESLLWGMPFRFTMPNALEVSTFYEEKKSKKTKDDTKVLFEVTTNVFNRGFNEMDEIEEAMKDSSNTTGSLNIPVETTSSSTSSTTTKSSTSSMSSNTTTSFNNTKSSTSSTSSNTTTSFNNTNSSVSAITKTSNSNKRSFVTMAAKTTNAAVDDDFNQCMCDADSQYKCVCLFHKGKVLNPEDLKDVLKQTSTKNKYSEDNEKYDRESLSGEAACIRTLITNGLVVDPKSLNERSGCGSYVQMMIKIMTVVFEAKEDGSLAHPERMQAYVRYGMGKSKNRMHAAGVTTFCKRLASTFGFCGTEEENNTDGSTSSSTSSSSKCAGDDSKGSDVSSTKRRKNTER